VDGWPSALYPIGRYGADMTLRAPFAAAALVVALLLPGAAGAAELAPLKPCYISPPDGRPQTVALDGSGFTASSTVDVYLDGALAVANIFVEADGSFRGGVPAPQQEKGERPFSVTAVERENPANSATQSARVTAFRVRVRPLRGRPDRRARFSGAGFTGPGPVYAHYSRKERLRATVELSAPAAPCGTFEVKRPKFPLRDPKPGIWTVQFDQERDYRREPADAIWYALEIPVFRKPR
jgi:hypothetical protein